VGKLEDGRTVFVPRTAPGDLVELSGLRTHARFARARIGALLEEGPGRTQPRCPHYVRDQCGGCQLQHLEYPVQLEVKRSIVEDALRRIGKLELTVPAVVASPDPWQYRSRISLTPGPGRRFAGFHPVDRPTSTFPLLRCEIAAPAVQRLWEAIRTALHLLPPDTEQLVLREDRTGGLHVIVRATGTQAWSDGGRVAAATARAGIAATIWWQPEKGALRVVAGEREPFPATVFEQVHPAMGDRIREDAINLLGPAAGEHLWDLYAGIGETTERLADSGATVESVELDRRAVEMAARRAGAPDPDISQRPSGGGVVRHVGRVEDLVARLEAPAGVIANPPRGGMAPEVVQALLDRRPRRIVYISCDPATLARDLARLAGAPAELPGPYTLVSVRAYDLFPQTAHVETVAVLEA
jgi:23S rRNA (uracil1939-C5)-methyltransferase